MLEHPANSDAGVLDSITPENKENLHTALIQHHHHQFISTVSIPKSPNPWYKILSNHLIWNIQSSTTEKRLHSDCSETTIFSLYAIQVQVGW